jgi:hypothetical protein
MQGASKLAMTESRRTDVGDSGRASADARRLGLRYYPFYCEENAWWLCGEPVLADGDATVVLISATAGCCPFAEQRAAPPGRVVWWDYHVVVLDAERRIWDLDTRLPLPVAALVWLDRTFPAADRLPAPFSPRFRLAPCREYRRDFASDRSHMRDADGRWRRPPPPWPPIGTGMSLQRFVDPIADRPGVLVDARELRRRLSD